MAAASAGVFFLPLAFRRPFFFCIAGTMSLSMAIWSRQSLALSLSGPSTLAFLRSSSATSGVQALRRAAMIWLAESSLLYPVSL